MSEETVTITKADYESLQASSRMLIALEVAGVDNWLGYDGALDLFEAMNNN